MAEQRVQRRLAAILAADVVGYSRLMGTDEAGTRARLNDQLDEIVQPTIDEHRGRLVKTMGDGFLVEFGSVVDAVQCAADIQTGVAVRQAREPEDHRMLLRIGVHLGDVIVEGEDIHGDGVNIAARLEGLAEPGGVCISGMVHEGIRNKLSVAFDDLGQRSLKNIADPVRVYGLRARNEGAVSDLAAFDESIFRRPAVAVLPFQNLSGDPDQEYFADGLTEDIITALSLWRSFPVISGSSTFSYKGQSPDIREVARELGARYIIEGSVRLSGQRVRVAAQLSDAESGHHVWAERYDRELEDMFDLQDEIARTIAATVEPQLSHSELQRLVTKKPANLDAWSLYQQGMGQIQRFSKEGNATARNHFESAIALDPNYSQAYSGLAFSHHRDIVMSFAESRDSATAAMLSAAEKAVALDDADGTGHTLLSLGYLFAGQHDLAVVESERAMSLNPSNYFALVSHGVILDTVGRTDEAIAAIENGLKLNPNNPRLHIYAARLARAHLNAHHYEDAIMWAQRAVSRKSDDIDSR